MQVKIGFIFVHQMEQYIHTHTEKKCYSFQFLFGFRALIYIIIIIIIMNFSGHGRFFRMSSSVITQKMFIFQIPMNFSFSYAFYLFVHSSNQKICSIIIKNNQFLTKMGQRKTQLMQRIMKKMMMKAILVGYFSIKLIQMNE